jgi:uncharacterized protein (TIGR02466 family)
MSSIETIFPTSIYRAQVCSAQSGLNKALVRESYQFQKLDQPGREWCKKNYPGGYTSYGSITNLFSLSPYFKELQEKIDQEVWKFAKSLQMDFQARSPKKALKMDTLWINIMPKSVVHTSHIHPLSVISGTYYAAVPKGASGLKFEDPRMSSFMYTPPRTPSAHRKNQWFIEIHSQAGSIVLFESWLRHEVPPSTVEKDRISISFNYGWH